MIDVVYVLGTGSKWEDNELRYSLRSIEKYLKYNKVFVVGEKPTWLQGVTHIPYPDEHKEKETRIALKVLVACKDERVSKEFLFMNDDIFLTKHDHAQFYPNYYSGTLQDADEQKGVNMVYRNAIKNTVYALSSKYNRYFDVHTPIVYNREKFSWMMEKYNWDKEFSYVVKSMYANSLGLSGKNITDCKIDHIKDTNAILERIKNVPCFSVSDRGLGEAMKGVLQKLYPEKSKYEI